MRPTGWLTGAVINMALEMACCCAATRCFPVVSDVLLSRAENHAAYAARLRDAPYDFLLPLYLGGNHWALAHLLSSAKLANVYDSLPSAAHEAEAQGAVQRFLADFLGQDVMAWQVTAAACPRQEDGSSCGIFAIATAMYVLCGRAVPASPYRSDMWRVLVARLVGLRAPGATLWPFSRDEDEQAAALPSALPEVAAFRRALEAGRCSLSEGQALAASIAKAMAAAGRGMVPTIKKAMEERRRALGELRAVAAFVEGARAVAGGEGVEAGVEDARRAQVARLVVERLGGECVGASVRDGVASVSWLGEQLAIAERGGRGD